MAGQGGTSGKALAVLFAGGVLLWSGLNGKKVTGVLRNVIAGKSPTGAANTAGAVASAGGNTPNIPAGPVNAAGEAALKAYAVGLLALHGWPGQSASLFAIVAQESSWNPLAHNASGAFGIAQALGHGNANTVGKYSNSYGNFGTSDAVCKAANDGSGTAQLQWMCNYIAEKYGSPDNAEVFHLANNSY